MDLRTIPDVDVDQIRRIVTDNRVFLKDFLLLICGLIIFLIIIAFFVLIVYLAIMEREYSEEVATFRRNYGVVPEFRPQ